MPEIPYSRDISPFDNDSDPDNTWTDQQIADELQGQTQNEISITAARDGFARGQWWYQKNGGEYEGALQSALDNPATPQEVKDVLSKLWTLVFGVSSQSGCQTTLQRASDGGLDPNQFAGVLQDTFVTLLGQGVVASKAVGQFYGLGGLKYPDQGDPPTAADVAASRDAYNAQSQLETNRQLLSAEQTRLYNTYFAPVLQSDTPTDAACKSALTQMSASWVNQLS